MGMFDSIKIKRKLPLSKELKDLNINWDKVSFQTKALENYMGHYFIDKRGYLFEEVVEGDWIPVPEDQRDVPWHVADFEEKKRYNKKIDFHGVLKFYAYEELNDKEDFWVDFAAYFIYGKLDKIELLEFKRTESNKFSIEEWQKEHNEEQKKLWNRIKKVLRKIGWEKFWNIVAKLLYKFSGFIQKIQYYITRYVA
jgi:hypothetical protein